MLGKRLAFLRGNLTQNEVAYRIGISRARYSHYETGRSEPDAATLRKLSEYFNCTTDYLLGLSELPLAKKIPHIPAQLPVLGSIRAGLPVLAEENIEGYLDLPESINADFALRIQGESMIGVGILDGDYAVCRKDPEPRSGQIIVALCNEGSISEATLKFYFYGNGQPHLRAANPAYLDIDYHDGYSCVGYMVALLRKDAPTYQAYKKYLAINDSEEWMEVIALAGAAGLNINQVKEILKGQIEIAKRLKGV